MHSVYQNLLKHAFKSRDPIYTVVELTYRCNYRCQFCYVDHDAASLELDVDSWTKIFKDLKSAGCISVLLTGGETLLHTGCIQILRNLKELGFLTSLFTNASLIKKETASELAKLNLGEIGITLYGADAQTHDTYTKNPGSFNHVINAIRTLKDLGCNTQLKWNAISGLVEHTQAFISLAENLGVEWHANGVISICRDGCCKGRVSDEELRFFYSKLIEKSYTLEKGLKEAEHIASKWKMEMNPNANMCAAGRISGRIDPAGILFPCIDIHEPIGDLTKKSFSELWNKSPLWQKFLSMILKDFPNCLECSHYHVCKYMCPGAFRNETGSYYGVSLESCRNTKAFLYAINKYLDEKIGRDKNPINQFMEITNE